MQIGLIGGIGPAATDFYYRRLIATFAARRSPLELTIAHADTPTLVDNLGRNDKTAQAEIFAGLASRLAAAGANFVAITSIGGHFCIDSFKAKSPLPAVDMITEVNRAVAATVFNRLGILGTRTVMETRFYGGLTTATIIPPSGRDLIDVHDAYVAMAASALRMKLNDQCSIGLAGDCSTTALKPSCWGAPILHWSTITRRPNSR
jgi:aspartate racemase